MSKLRHVSLSNFHEPNPVLKELHQIFSETLNEKLNYLQFRFFYFMHKPHFMDITFIEEDNKVIGFVCVTFYRHVIEDKGYTICRGATGIKKGYRGGKLPSFLFCWKYIKYKIHHRHEEMYVTGYMASPILYTMICKHTHLVYPKAGIAIPPHINELHDKLLRFYRLEKKLVSPFKLKIHFQVNITEEDLKRIYASPDRDIQFFKDKMGYEVLKQVGLFTIVPVTWYNVSVSLIRGLITRPFIRKQKQVVKYYAGIKESLQSKLSKISWKKLLPVNLLNQK